MRRFLGFLGYVVGLLSFGAAASWAIDPSHSMTAVAVCLLFLWVSGSVLLVHLGRGVAKVLTEESDDRR